MSLDELNLVRFDKNRLDGHVAVDVGREVQLDGRCEAVGVFDGETVVFHEQLDVVTVDGLDDFVSTCNLYGRTLRGERVQCSVIETDKLDGNIPEILGLDFLNIDKNFCHGIAGCHKRRESFGHKRDGICLAILDAVDEQGVRRNVDDAGERISCAGDLECFLEELWRLYDDVAGGWAEVYVILDGDVSLDTRIDGDVNEKVLVVGFYVVDRRKVRGYKVLEKFGATKFFESRWMRLEPSSARCMSTTIAACFCDCRRMRSRGLPSTVTETVVGGLDAIAKASGNFTNVSGTSIVSWKSFSEMT